MSKKRKLPKYFVASDLFTANKEDDFIQSIIRRKDVSSIKTNYPQIVTRIFFQDAKGLNVGIWVFKDKDDFWTVWNNLTDLLRQV